MKIDPEILESYYDGKMSISERESFERLIISDPQVADDLKNYILSRTAIASASNERLKKHLIESGKLIQMPDQRKSYVTRYLAIAASIAILIDLGWITYLFLNPHKSMQEIYVSYYQRPDINEFTVRSEGSDSGQLFWVQGLNYYATHKIELAAAEFNKIIRITKDNSVSKAYFMLALCYMEMNDTQKAIQTFAKVSDQSNFVFMKQYYSALCFIKMDKKEEANNLLYAIVRDENHPYSKNALRILREF